MSIAEALEISLPLLLYFLGAVLLVVLIVFVIKLTKTLDEVNKLVLDVNTKVHSLDGVFNVINFTSEKITSMSTKIADKFKDIVIGFKKKKYNDEEEDIYE